MATTIVNAPTTYGEDMVIGLKSNISKQVGIRKNVEKTLGEMNDLFVQTIGTTDSFGLSTEKLVWEYVKINHIWWKGESEKLGIFSYIDDYTNKQGKVSKAHYSQNGCYISRAKEGDNPISYTGHFRLTPDKFDYEFFKKGEKWEIKFEPKEQKIQVVT